VSEISVSARGSIGSCCVSVLGWRYLCLRELTCTDLAHILETDICISEHIFTVVGFAGIDRLASLR
jgi:hypothetical protein